MAVSAPRPLPPRPRPARWRLAVRTTTVLVLTAILATGLVWWRGPVWLAPIETFAQGPGGAVAYVTIANQIREQSAAFWTGGDVHMQLDQAEFSGMLSSALLTGRTSEDPIQRVRGSLVDGEIKVEAIVQLPNSPLPERFRGPIGVRLRLNPVVTERGLVQFQITRAYAGRVPIPPTLIRWVGRLFPVIDIAGFDARAAAISLPLGDMVSSSLGRKLEIKRVSANDGRLQITIAMPDEVE